jgi:hypothetical protein
MGPLCVSINIAGRLADCLQINQEKIGKGQQRLLKDGNEVAFGVATKSTEQGGLYDYREFVRTLSDPFHSMPQQASSSAISCPAS